MGNRFVVESTVATTTSIPVRKGREREQRLLLCRFVCHAVVVCDEEGTSIDDAKAGMLCSRAKSCTVVFVVVSFLPDGLEQ